MLSAKLAGGHKGGVTKLLPVAGRDAAAPERLASAAVDGTIALWDPSTAGLGAAGAVREVSPAAMAKPHDGEIFSMAVVVAQTNSLGSAAPWLVTAGRY